MGMLRGTVGFRGAHSKLELQRSNSGETIGQSDNSSLAKPPGGHSRPENETRAILKSKSNGIDDVRWFICYRHSKQGVSRVNYDVKRCSCS